MSTIRYANFNSIPDEFTLQNILRFHRQIFEDSSSVLARMKQQKELVICLAMVDEQIVGYKMGYALSDQTFYSWLGGVDVHYRGQGIAKKLMDMQHAIIHKKGFRIVQTKTLNRFRPMLLFNIKSGFDIVDTYVDERDELKIVLEKKLGEL